MLQLVLFVLLYTTTLMQYTYGSSSLANNSIQHFARNNNTRLVTLDQLSPVAVMDLTGSIDEGSYRVTLRLGEAAMEYSFIIDTGSDLTWVNCETESPYNYQYPHPPYEPPALHTVLCSDHICNFVSNPTELPCDKPSDICYYATSYVDDTTTSGVMILESLALPFINVDPTVLPPSMIYIGCGFHQYHPSATEGRVENDGVLGLPKKSDLSIVTQLADNGITRPVFGHCMSRPRGGYFFIGAGFVLPPAITWAPMVTLDDEDIYSPGQADLLFDERLTTVRNLEAVFDSGATVSYFKSDALEAIIDLVKANLVRASAPLTQVQREGYPICWTGVNDIGSVDEVAAYFKTMTLIFPAANNAQFELPPYAYLMVEPRHIGSHAGDVCFAIFDAAEQGLEEINLIGAISFQNKLVIYDLVREMIGWAPSNCDDRRTNDRKRHHVNDRKYRRKDVSRHHFSSNIPMRRQPALAK